MMLLGTRGAASYILVALVAAAVGAAGMWLHTGRTRQDGHRSSHHPRRVGHHQTRRRVDPGLRGVS